MVSLRRPRKLTQAERVISAAAGILAIISAFSLLYFVGHGFALLGIILTLVGLMWVAWAVLGRDY